MWRDVLPALAAAGFHALAPACPATATREAARRPRGSATSRRSSASGASRVSSALTLVVHDWGGLIGLRWACDHPGVANALVISDSGFFSDGKWRGPGEILRTEGQGEQFVEGVDREGFAGLLGCVSTEHRARRRRRVLQGVRRRGPPPRPARALPLRRLREARALRGPARRTGVPTLLLWGADDFAAPVAGAHRFADEIPGSEVVVLEGTGHFVVDDAPERYAEELVRFLRKASPGTAR